MRRVSVDKVPVNYLFDGGMGKPQRIQFFRDIRLNFAAAVSGDRYFGDLYLLSERRELIENGEDTGEIVIFARGVEIFFFLLKDVILYAYLVYPATLFEKSLHEIEVPLSVFYARFENINPLVYREFVVREIFVGEFIAGFRVFVRKIKVEIGISIKHFV